MLLATEKRTEKSTGLKGDIEYSFATGPHMMMIMSDIYANPDIAVVREYLTNMYDAHIALHRKTGDWGPKPTLNLPTTLNPTLVFQDRGIGMSQADVTNIFVKYGESTKSDSNDEVGGFGLGAKVGFAYNGGVDWSIETIKNGEKNIYIARVGVKGMPVLSHVASEVTEEHSGTKITIPTRRQDITRIVEAARNLLQYFPIPIEVTGTNPVVPFKATLESDNWQILKGDYSRNAITAIVGNVPYLVDHGMRSEIVKLLGEDKQHFYYYNQFVLHLPVGSVDIVPSRDSLKYTDKTKEAIAEVLKKIRGGIQEVASNIVSKATSEYEALELFHSIDMLDHIEDMISSVKYNGMTLRRGDRIKRKVSDFPNTTFTGWGITDVDKSEIVEINCTKEIEVAVSDKFTTLLIDDVAKGHMRVAKSLAHQNLVTKTSSGRAARWGQHHRGSVLIINTKLTPQELSKKLGGVPVERFGKVSDHKKVRAPAGLGINVENIYKFTGKSWAARVKVPTDGVNYYLPLTKGQARYTFHDNADRVARLVGEGVALGMFDEKYRLFGIRSDEVANYDAASWINLETAITKNVVISIEANKQALANYYDLGSGMYAHTKRLHEAEPFVKVCPELKVWSDGIKSINVALADLGELMTTIRQYSNATAVSDALKKLPKSTIAEPDAMWKMVEQKYPMLVALISLSSNKYGYTLSSFAGHVEKYVKGIAP